MTFTKQDAEQLKIWKLAGEEMNKAMSDIYDKVRDLETKKMIMDNTPLIGKHFTFSNSYLDDKTWTEYVKITGINESGNLIGQQFSKDSYGIIDFKANHDVSIVSSYLTSGEAKTITKKQYEKERTKLLKEGGFI